MSKLIKCKSCGAEIARNAKVCPQCGAKNGLPKGIGCLIWIIAVIFAIIIFAVSGGDDGSAPTKKGDAETTPTVSGSADVNSANANTGDVSTPEQPEETVFSVGDTLETKKFEITVTNVETRSKVGSQYLSTEPSEGGIYVCVNLEYKNITKEPISSFSLPTVRLKDSEGTVFDSDISASSYYATETDPDRKVWSDLNPGIKVRDSKVFEISKEDYEVGGFSVYIKSDMSFDVKIN